MPHAPRRAGGAARGDNGLAWLLVLENLVFAAEAEVRWLDHVETMLARRPGPTASAPGAAAHATHQPTTATRQQPAVVSSTNPGGDHS